ncbi:MAG TPA: sulfatase [Verrucomicrobiae bacterium]|nr:sulfatase [Verrucomicrobiae bacterium]
MNVLILCSDTFRYDHLGYLKRQQVYTPNLNSFASESATFSDFWLSSFPTLVNRIDVFTGRFAFPFYKWGPLPREYPVLSEIFTRHGFATAMFADNFNFFRRGHDYERGFAHSRRIRGQCHDPILPRSAPMADLPCPADRMGLPQDRLERYRRNARMFQEQGRNSPAQLFGSVIDWFQDPPNKFFVWIDAFDPHEPWDAPKDFQRHYPHDPNGTVIPWPKGGPASEYSPAELLNMRNLYKAEATEIDFWFGKLLDVLRNKGLLENTAVIFCSDHGFYFGEHNLIGKPVRMAKRTAIYEELGHIPLVIRHPKGLSAGRAISGLAQPLDLFPTALELAGIPRVPWTQGHSLVPRLEGAPSPQQFAVSGYHPHRGRASCITVTTKDWALMHSPTPDLQPSELYHMPTDPLHTRNVVHDNPDAVRELFGLVDHWLDDLGVPASRKRQLLHNAPFTLWHKLAYKCWVTSNRVSYWKNYRRYARPTGKPAAR